MLTKLRAMFGWKCPRCGHGDLYKTSFFEGVYNMHHECPKCKQDFEMEPGFYWGAMYMGYALSGGYMLAGFVVCMWGLGLTPNQSFAVLVVSLFLMFPLIARTARAIWIGLNVSYEPETAKEVEAAESEKNKPKSS